jgi:hypothetical protein
MCGVGERREGGREEGRERENTCIKADGGMIDE